MNAAAQLTRPVTSAPDAPSLLHRVNVRARSIAARLLGRTPEPTPDQNAREFIEFCRRHWPAAPAGDRPLILMHQTAWYPSVLCYAFVSHALARREDASLASFGFGGTGRPLDELFAGFGAPNILGQRELRKHRPRAEQLAEQIFRGFKSRRDVANFSFEGVSLGDVVYDSYLRYHSCHTVDLNDRRLRDAVRDALLRFLAARELLDSRKIAMILVDHAVYMDAGILSRLAILRGIPVYQLPYQPVSLLRLDPVAFPHHVAGPDSPEAGQRTAKLALPYHHFRNVFAALPEAGRAERRKIGREKLENRLSGKFDFRVLFGGSAYARTEGPQLLADTGRPRIVVMMHDFCDAPHAYRDLIFEDHFQWVVWLFGRVTHSSCDWYAKEHPNSAHDHAKAALNRRTTDELKTRFPHIRFLPPNVSNLQLIEEGVSAIFTGYGTVGHEFAYAGIPVVNAGDNPHINYGFTYHPQTVEELAELVDGAGELRFTGDRAEIEEYAYLRYEHFYDRSFHTVQFVPPELERDPESFRKVNTSSIFRYASEDPTLREAQLDEYLERLFSSGRHLLPE